MRSDPTHENEEDENNDGDNGLQQEIEAASNNHYDHPGEAKYSQVGDDEFGSKL